MNDNSKITINNLIIHNTYNYINSKRCCYYKGEIEFQGEEGSIKIDINNDLCNAIIALCLGKITKECQEQIKRLEESFIEHVKNSPVNSENILPKTFFSKLLCKE